MIIDVHCHYTLSQRQACVERRFSFEPAVDNGAPAFDSCVAPRTDRWLAWRAMRWLLGIDGRLPRGEALDRRLEQVYAAHLLAPGPIERYVLLAFDWYHTREGRRPPLPRDRDSPGSDIYTSNSLVADLCRRYPQRFLFGASIHPYRPDAVACVDEVFAAGACLIKWLPLNQNIDITDPRTLRVLRRCRELGLPLLVHYSEEFTLSTQHPEYQSVEPLLEVLRRLRSEGGIPPVIVAHAATPNSPWAERGTFERFLDALGGEFAEEPLYADISALAAPVKTGFLRRLARQQELHAKLLFGSDFPVPLGMFRLRRDLGRDYRRIAAEPSWPQRMVAICRHVGFNEIVFHRAAGLLPNVSAAAP
jgi:hypothetical protein